MHKWHILTLAGAALGVVLWRRGAREHDGRSLATRYGPWAIITGAAREAGIGYGFARELAAAGINLVLVDVLAEALQARAAALALAYGVQVKPLALDLGRRDFLPELQAATADLDVGLLVCNHMAAPAGMPAILEMDLAAHHRMLDVNARAYTMLLHAYGRQMVAQGRGGLVIVASQAALHGTPYTGAYAANKAFQLMLGESLWYELRGSGVDVLVLLPGRTRTDDAAPAGFPRFMLMDVDPVVREALAALGRRHLVIPGVVNKLLQFVANHVMSRRQALLTSGRTMDRWLGK
ncbi:MAG: SDR family NAD(P)-dependent oxidoreductase [Anaerolineales bacterium]|nr:SDR family NAD(P)-dependent oxidoreductase [Anaerolineales bacterium]